MTSMIRSSCVVVRAKLAQRELPPGSPRTCMDRTIDPNARPAVTDCKGTWLALDESVIAPVAVTSWSGARASEMAAVRRGVKQPHRPRATWPQLQHECDLRCTGAANRRAGL